MTAPRLGFDLDDVDLAIVSVLILGLFAFAFGPESWDATAAITAIAALARGKPKGSA